MTEPVPFQDLASLIAAHARACPGAPALRQGAQSLSYGELDRTMNRVAAALQRLGWAPGDAIAICAGTSPQYVAVFLGALRAGLVVAPLAPGATATQLRDMARDADARGVFVDDSSAALAVDWPAPITSLEPAAFEAWLGAAGNAPAPVVIQPDWPFNIIYSSGTTGTPKGIVQPHAMRWAHIQRAGLSGYDADTVTVIATPLYSNTTLVCLIPTLACGGCAVLMPKFDALQYLQLAQQHGATHTMLVPVQYRRLMVHPEFDRFDLSAFRAKFSTSAPFHAELKADVLKRWPGGLTEYYGLTEGGGTCILAAHLHPSKLHTVGQPAPGHDIRLIDEDGIEVAPGTSGEVVGRSPGMMTGYHRQPALTAEAEWFDGAGRRFIRTGDVARFDEDGFLILLDRRKDMIISGGFNIYPSDLEAVLRQHPAVADVAVVGVSSAEWGETPVAFVVRHAGAAGDVDDSVRDSTQDSAAAIRQWANAQVGKTQRLHDLRLIDELPRSAIGKVLKRELRQAWSA